MAPTATACLSSGFPDLVADLTAAYDAGSPIFPQVHLEFTVKNAGAGLACGSTVAVTCGNRTSTAGVPALAQNEAITVKMDFSPVVVLKPKTSLIVLDSTNAVQEFEGEANNDYTTVTLVTFCG